MFLYSKEEYWTSECDDYTCGRGIAQFMICATPGTKEQNNCEIQLLTRYGGRKMVSTEYVARECPADLRHSVWHIVWYLRIIMGIRMTGHGK